MTKKNEEDFKELKKIFKRLNQIWSTASEDQKFFIIWECELFNTFRK